MIIIPVPEAGRRVHGLGMPPNCARFRSRKKITLRLLPKYFWQLILVALVAGCASSGWYRRVPLLLPDWQIIDLTTGGVCQQVEFFDYNCDGEVDLLLVGERQIACFAGKDGRWSSLPNLVIPFPQKIGGFDLVRPPGRETAWLVVRAGGQLFFIKDIASGDVLQNIDYAPQATSMPCNWLFSRYHGVQMFQDIDGDTVPDLVVPFRRGLNWCFAIYLYQNGSFVARGKIDVAEAQLPLPPAFYVLAGGKSPMLLVEGSRSLKFYQADAISGFASNPGWQIAVSRIIPESSADSPPVIRACGQLNRQGAEELILAGLNGKRIWLWSDQQRVETLLAAGAATLMVAFKDIDGDNWHDIVCVRLAVPDIWQALGSLSNF